MKDTKSLRRTSFVIVPCLLAAVAVYLVYRDYQRRAVRQKSKERLEAEMHAVNELGKIGAFVYYGTPRHPHMKSVTFLTIGGVKDGKAVTKVPQIADDDLKHLAVLTNLGELQLTAKGFTNVGLEHLHLVPAASDRVCVPVHGYPACI